MILAALLVAMQSVEPPVAYFRLKDSPVYACVANQRVSRLFDGNSELPNDGYRLVYTLMGDQPSLTDLGSAFEKEHKDARWTVLPVLKGRFLFTLEIDAFRGNQHELAALTYQVCNAAIERKVKLLGWQLIDRNRTVAGASDNVDE